MGIEPTTFPLPRERSTTELLWLGWGRICTCEGIAAVWFTARPLCLLGNPPMSLRSPWRPIILKRSIGLSPFFLEINLPFAIWNFLLRGLDLHQRSPAYGAGEVLLLYPAISLNRGNRGFPSIALRTHPLSVR